MIISHLNSQHLILLMWPLLFYPVMDPVALKPPAEFGSLHFTLITELVILLCMTDDSKPTGWKCC